MSPFIDDDAGYLKWLAEHPDEFVVNTARKPHPSYLVLHRATCTFITGSPTRGTRWTGDYVKYCGGLSELQSWALTEVGGDLQPCGHCLK
ncbi:hypothetical protein Psi02_14030 [Planotetraspora silvatica]|uniref:Uncharacterized protein n=1 Tax=Planotetraspora silvatica TaxID=234614 RepID=A0A8J3UG66_9ACTN|nr:hypothetical protein [Planotetraspora silvatica]GII44979.1 hypothetical protein Psi02_14030 [Planotetraspora silvatica]